MRAFRYDATISTPPALSAEVRDGLRSRLETFGMSHVEIHEDEEGQATVSFVLEAPSNRKATDRGTELTLEALVAFHNVAWLSGGVTDWHEP
jgi:hypothetical protein